MSDECDECVTLLASFLCSVHYSGQMFPLRAFDNLLT